MGNEVVEIRYTVNFIPPKVRFNDLPNFIRTQSQLSSRGRWAFLVSNGAYWI